MRAKDTKTITIRQTLTTSIKIAKSSENKESTATPVIVVVLERKG